MNAANRNTKMKKKHTKSWYERRAITGFLTLLKYFNVTRPQHAECYKVNGKFNKARFFAHKKWLEDWKSKPKGFKNRNAGLYAKISSGFNYTLGIDKELVKEILGHDINHKRISVDWVLVKLNGTVKEIGHGKKGKFDEDTRTFQAKSWWKKKYIYANRGHWEKLFKDPRYCDLATFPFKNTNEHVNRAINIIFEWVKREIVAQKAKKCASDVFGKQGVIDPGILGDLAPKVAKLLDIEPDQQKHFIKAFTCEYNKLATNKEEHQ